MKYKIYKTIYTRPIIVFLQKSILKFHNERELIALLDLSSWCLVMVERLFLTVPWGCLQFVIVVFPDHTHLLFLHLQTLTFIIQFQTSYDITK